MLYGQQNINISGQSTTVRIGTSPCPSSRDLHTLHLCLWHLPPEHETYPFRLTNDLLRRQWPSFHGPTSVSLHYCFLYLCLPISLLQFDFILLLLNHKSGTRLPMLRKEITSEHRAVTVCERH